MSELWGAPSGILASEQLLQNNLKSGLDAVKTLGEIEQQPAQKRVLEAQAQRWEAEADQDKLKSAAFRQQQALDTEFSQEEAAARLAEIEGIEATGQQATVANTSRPGTARKVSAADRLLRYQEFLERRGAPISMTAGIAKGIADIRKDEALAFDHTWRGLKNEVQAGKEQADQLGAMATYGKQGPQQYAIMLAQAAEKGMPIDHLPRTFGPAAVAELDSIIQSAVTVKDQMELKLKAATEKRQEALAASTRAVNAANIKLIGARIKNLDSLIDARIKNDGPDSPDVAREKERRDALKAAQERYQDMERFPPAPVKVEDYKIEHHGQTFTLANGARVRAIVDVKKDPKIPGSGYVMFEEVTPAPGTPAARNLSMSRRTSTRQRQLIGTEEDD